MCQFPNYFLKLKDKYDVKYHLTGVRSKLIFLTSVSAVERGDFKLEYNKDKYDLIVQPCGQCIACRYKHARVKAIQLQCESKSHQDNSFITLTFDNKKIYNFFIDKGYSRNTANRYVKLLTWSLEKKLFQNFMKRFRWRLEQEYLKYYSISHNYLKNVYYSNKKGDLIERERFIKFSGFDYSDYFPPRIKYYHCGEYGDLNSRPHHHAIIFGWTSKGDDIYTEKQYSYKRKRNEYIKRSKMLDKCWPFGNNQVGTATYQSMNYVARYCTKKIKGKICEEHYNGRMPEYETGSNREGLGFRDFCENVVQYVSNRSIPYLAENGELKECSLPRYFGVVLRRLFPKLHNKYMVDCFNYSEKYNNLTPSQLMSKSRRQQKDFENIDFLAGKCEFKSETADMDIYSKIIYESISKRDIFGFDEMFKTYKDIPEFNKPKTWRQIKWNEFEKRRNQRVSQQTRAIIDYKLKHLDSIDKNVFNSMLSHLDYLKTMKNPFRAKVYNKKVNFEYLKKLFHGERLV